MRRFTDGMGPWIVAGIVGWIGVIWIGWQLWQSQPPRAGFDLALLLDGARRVQTGLTPYDPALLAGASPDAVELFYSYPPPVAQVLTVAAWLPDGVVLILWAVGATLGFGLLGAQVARLTGRSPLRLAIRSVAVAPLVLPFAVALLFGNLDAWFPLLYGVFLLGALPGATNRAFALAGIGAAVATIAKLHPAPLLLWSVVRAIRERGGPQARVTAFAAAAALVIVGASLLLGGTGPWMDYAQVLRVVSGSEVVDPRNAGIASSLVLGLGLGGDAIRPLHLLVVAAVVALTVGSAARVSDPVTSVALATAASLATLPVAWYHYPVALMPVALYLAARHPVARPRLLLAVLVADAAIAVPAATWLAVAIVVVAAVESLRRTSRDRPRPRDAALSA